MYSPPKATTVLTEDITSSATAPAEAYSFCSRALNETTAWGGGRNGGAIHYHPASHLAWTVVVFNVQRGSACLLISSKTLLLVTKYMCNSVVGSVVKSSPGGTHQGFYGQYINEWEGGRTDRKEGRGGGKDRKVGEQEVKYSKYIKEN